MARLRCGNCGKAMQRLELAGHYGKQVEIDACGPCHLVWFDAIESVRLSGAGMLELLDAMARTQSECPRCDGALKTIHNRSRWGPTRLPELRRADRRAGQPLHLLRRPARHGRCRAPGVGAGSGKRHRVACGA